MNTDGNQPMSKKRAAFKRVVEPRIAEVLIKLEYLGAACDPVRYEIYPADAEYLAETLTRAMQDVSGRYRNGQRKPVIKLPD